MLTCVDCLHIEVCAYIKHDLPICSDFADRSKYVVREKGEWILHMDGSSTCKKCRTNTKYSWDFDNSFNFCPHCGADVRKGENDG